MVSRVIPVDTFDLVIFGGTGDLARRKILPGLFRRFEQGQMPPDARVIGAARSDLDDAGYQEMIREAMDEFLPKNLRQSDRLDEFIDQIGYVQIDATGEAGWKDLKKTLRDDVVNAFYFSVAPTLF